MVDPQFGVHVLFKTAEEPVRLCILYGMLSWRVRVLDKDEHTAKEMPNQEGLISCFLKGLRDKQLYMHLLNKEYMEFEECCDDVKKIDDNYNLLLFN